MNAKNLGGLPKSPPWNRGDKVWEWTIIASVRITGRSRAYAGYRVECSCSAPGNPVVRDIHQHHLETGNTKSCGHVRAAKKPKPPVPPKPPKTQTLTKTARVRIRYAEHDLIRHTWHGMVRRCHDPESENYEWYGGRGISVHPEWRESCEAFETWVWENLGPRPEGHSLDRIDNDGNYEPGNVRWADRNQQAQNSRPAIEARARREEADRAKAAEKQAHDEARKAKTLAKAAEREAQRATRRQARQERLLGRSQRWHEMNQAGMSLADIARAEDVSVANVSLTLKDAGLPVTLHNSSGYPGVKKVTKGKRTYYEARMVIDGKRVTLGSRKTPGEAHELYVAARNAKLAELPYTPVPATSDSGIEAGSGKPKRRTVKVRAA